MWSQRQFCQWVIVAHEAYRIGMTDSTHNLDTGACLRYATGNVKEFTMQNTDKTAVEIEWELDTPVREDIYEYIMYG